MNCFHLLCCAAVATVTTGCAVSAEPEALGEAAQALTDTFHDTVNGTGLSPEESVGYDTLVHQLSGISGYTVTATTYAYTNQFNGPDSPFMESQCQLMSLTVYPAYYISPSWHTLPTWVRQGKARVAGGNITGCITPTYQGVNSLGTIEQIEGDVIGAVESGVHISNNYSY